MFCILTRDLGFPYPSRLWRMGYVLQQWETHFLTHECFTENKTITLSVVSVGEEQNPHNWLPWVWITVLPSLAVWYWLFTVPRSKLAELRHGFRAYEPLFKRENNIFSQHAASHSSCLAPMLKKQLTRTKIPDACGWRGKHCQINTHTHTQQNIVGLQPIWHLLLDIQQKSVGSLTEGAHALLMCHLISFGYFQVRVGRKKKERWRTKQLYPPLHAIMPDLRRYGGVGRGGAVRQRMRLMRAHQQLETCSDPDRDLGLLPVCPQGSVASWWYLNPAWPFTWGPS